MFWLLVCHFRRPVNSGLAPRLGSPAAATRSLSARSLGRSWHPRAPPSPEVSVLVKKRFANGIAHCNSICWAGSFKELQQEGPTPTILSPTFPRHQTASVCRMRLPEMSRKSVWRHPTSLRCAKLGMDRSKLPGTQLAHRVGT